VAKLKKLDPTGAIADCTEAIRLKPEFTDAYCTRATAQLKLDKYDAAIADCTAAIARDAKCVEAFRIRSQAKREKGDLTGADDDQKQAAPAKK
jgi:tetratricopeptide (TPR) repeat protein